MADRPHRDTEESAPAEFPPEQPEADEQPEDGLKYGEEEVELEAALIQEEAELAADEKGEDHEMEGTEEAAAVVKEDDEASEAGSEDLEAPSSDEDEEEEEEEEAAEEDDDMEMGEGEAAKPAAHAGSAHEEMVTS